jgi:hypothetical protein
MIWMGVAESQCRDCLSSGPHHIQIVQENRTGGASVEKHPVTFYVNQESEAMLPPVGRVRKNIVIY